MEDTDNLIYFDNAASTPLFPELIDQFGELLQRHYANPGAPHSLGLTTRKELGRVSKELLELVGTAPDDSEIIWTSGGTEANNLALFGLNSFCPRPSGNSLVSTTVEHPSVFNPLRRLSQFKNSVKFVNVDRSGLIDFDHLATCLTKQTKLVSVCLVQNETGSIQDLAGVREIMNLKAPGALLHIDAVQALGKLDIPWESARVDLMSFAGHKIHGPGGVGALVIRKRRVKLTPVFEGGGQQNNLRSGSLDVPGIFMFCSAVKKLFSIKKELMQKTSLIIRKTRDGFNKLYDRRGRRLNVQFNSGEHGSPFIINVSLPAYEGAIVMRMLGERHIIIGTGSACSAESKSPSRILTSMGVSRKSAFEAIRLSFGYQNSEDEVDTFFNELQRLINEY